MKRFVNLTLGEPFRELHVVDTDEGMTIVPAGYPAPLRRSDLPPEEAALSRLGKPRWFMDRDAVGDEYLVPAERRWDWDAWCIACENTCEVLPPPEWAKKLQDQIRWVEFECPVEVSV